MALNDLFKEQQRKMELKYKKNIEGISDTNGVDMGVAFDMLLTNYRYVCEGNFAEVYPGGGVIDFGELGADIKKLDETRRK